MNSNKPLRGRSGVVKKQPTGDYEAGYAKPPEHGKIQKGEVRNPHGRNGKPRNARDPFEKVMACKSRVTIDGEVTMLTTEEAFYMKMTALALSGNIGAARIVQAELHRRAKSMPEIPTQAELAQAEADDIEKHELSARLVQLLEEKATQGRHCARVVLHLLRFEG